MSRFSSRITKLEAALQPPTPDPALEARFRRACQRLAAQLEEHLGLQETGPIFRTTDPYTALKAAERRAECEDR